MSVCLFVYLGWPVQALARETKIAKREERKQSSSLSIDEKFTWLKSLFALLEFVKNRHEVSFAGSFVACQVTEMPVFRKCPDFRKF